MEPEETTNDAPLGADTSAAPADDAAAPAMEAAPEAPAEDVTTDENPLAV